MADPRISVVIAVHNAAPYLAETLQSVLSQEQADFEIVLVEDGSTDATPEIAARFAARDPRVRVLTNPQNLGIGRSANRGLEAARGEYVARIDGDDVALPFRLRDQAALLDAEPAVGVVGGHIELIDSSGRHLGERRYPLTDVELKRRMFRFSPFAHSATMYRTAAARQVGGYDQRFTPAEDVDLWFKLGRAWRFASLDRLVVRYRLHTSSATARRGARQQLETLRIRLRAALLYGYRPRPLDVVFSLAQLAVLPVPYPLKMRLFERYRLMTGAA